MSNEILYPASATGNFKAIVTKGATVWNGTAMAALAAAAKASGAITLTRQGTTLDYVGSFPSGIVTAGKYSITVIDAATPDGTEAPVAAGDINWTGTAEDVPHESDIYGFVDTEVAAIKAKTDNLPSDPVGASVVASSFSTVNATLATIAGYIDTEVAAIKAKTDNLPSSAWTIAAIAALVWDEALAGHATAGTAGAKLTAAASAGDPWTTAIPGSYGAGSAGFLLGAINAAVDTEIAAIKAKTDNLPALPASDTNVSAIKTVTDKLGDMITGSSPNYAFDSVSLANAPSGGGGGSVTLDMTQAVPTSNTAGTVGDALNAARAQGFGKWVKSGTTLTLYAPNGTTVVKTFTLDDADAPTTRA